MTYDAWKTRSPDDDFADHDGPEEIEECPNCEGGVVYVALPATWDDAYPDRIDVCPVCDGLYMRVVQARPDGPSEAEIERSQSFLAVLLGEEATT